MNCYAFGCSHTVGDGSPTNYVNLLSKEYPDIRFTNLAKCGCGIDYVKRMFSTIDPSSSYVIVQLPEAARQPFDYMSRKECSIDEEESVSNLFVSGSLKSILAINNKKKYYERYFERVQAIFRRCLETNNKILFLYYSGSYPSKHLYLDFLKDFSFYLDVECRKLGARIIMDSEFSMEEFRRKQWIADPYGYKMHPNIKGHEFIKKRIVDYAFIS